MDKMVNEQMRVVKTLGFKTSDVQDGELLQLVNNYARYFPGIQAKSLLRNFLLKALPKEIERLHQAQSQAEKEIA